MSGGAELPLSCACGAVRGAIADASPANGNRCICYCDDCQAYARCLGGAATVLDEHGGTDIFQVSQGRVSFSAGEEHVACLTLRPGGLLRWYADCCATLLCNTPPNPGLPVAGFVHSCLGPPAAREAVTGPVRGGVFGRYARGDRAALHAHDTVPVAMLLRFVLLLLRWRFRGDHKRSPFFDSRTRAPRVAPRILSPTELEAAQRPGDVVT